MAADTRAVEPAEWLRPSSVIIALGVGLGAGFASLLSASGDGAVTGLEVGRALLRAGSGFGWTLFVVWVLPIAFGVLDFVLGIVAGWRAVDSSPEPPDAAPLVSPLVEGKFLDEAEVYVRDGLLRTLQHARAAGGLTFSDIGHAFNGNTKHWVWWTDVLADNDLADKANGVATTLPKSRTYAWTLRQVQNGLFTAPELPTGALPPQPVPFDESYYRRDKLEKALKAG